MELQNNAAPVPMPTERVVFVLVERDLEDRPESKPFYWTIALASPELVDAGLPPTGFFYPCGVVGRGQSKVFAACGIAEHFLGLTATADDFDRIDQFEGKPVMIGDLPPVMMVVTAYRYKGKLRRQDIVVANGMVVTASSLDHMIDPSIAPLHEFNAMIAAKQL